jgi:hypothetical protein
MTETRLTAWKNSIGASDLQATTRQTLMGLAHFMDREGYCYPSMQTVADFTGQGLRTVKKHIALAIKSGFLGKAVKGATGQGWRLNEYRARVPEDPAAAPITNFDNSSKAGAQDAPRNSDNPPQGGAPECTNVVHGVHPNYQELPEEKEGPPAGEPNPPESDDQDDAEEYPYERKVIRLTARDWEAWKAEYRLTDEELAELLDERDAYLATLPKSHPTRKRWWIPTMKQIAKEADGLRKSQQARAS